jgi:hypothetical protein
MNNTELRYVAHFDILGMSRLTLQNPDLAWSTLSHLAIANQERLSIGFDRNNTRHEMRERVYTFTFSDTIVAFTKSDSIEDLHSITIYAIEIFARALFRGVPLRGGVSHGKFVFNLDLNLFSGPALVNAYHIGECAQWIGIVADEIVANRIKDIPMRAGAADVAVSWDIPQKDLSLKKMNVLNWPAVHAHNFIIRPPLDTQGLYKAFEHLFGPFSDLPVDVQAKYSNSVTFINHFLHPHMKS